MNKTKDEHKILKMYGILAAAVILLVLITLTSLPLSQKKAQSLALDHFEEFFTELFNKHNVNDNLILNDIFKDMMVVKSERHGSSWYVHIELNNETSTSFVYIVHSRNNIVAPVNFEALITEDLDSIVYDCEDVYGECILGGRCDDIGKTRTVLHWCEGGDSHSSYGPARCCI